MTYAAYLRVYEPVSAFPEPDRSRWAAYAALPTRPARRGSVAAEQAELAEVGRWLAEFHPYSLVELDYGGLVHVLSDEALRGDQSVAEIAAAIDAAARGDGELAVAMYKRARSRWRAFADFEKAN
jgi:hypothetical protein